MMQRSDVAARPTKGERAARRAPELPRVIVDTRMPAAPAPGGRVIVVAPSAGRIRKGGLDGGVVLGGLVAATLLTFGWRLVRRRGLHAQRPT